MRLPRLFHNLVPGVALASFLTAVDGAGSAPAGSMPVQPGAWAARWIWQADDGPPNSWVAFRQTVAVTTVPKRVTARIAADSKFWLWINGRMVLFEGGVARGPSPSRPWERQPEIWKLGPEQKPSNTWYEEVEIAEYLQPGPNTIAVLVWYWGRETHKGTHIDSGRGGLLFQADIGGQRVVSDASWKVRMHPAYALDSGDSGRNLIAYPVKFDARQAMGDWTEAAWHASGYPDASWSAAVEKGTPPTAPWYQLVKNPVPPLTNHGLQDYPSHPAARFPFTGAGGEIRCDLPFNMQINPYLEVDAPEGQVIEITTDNPLNKITAHYTTRAGRQAFESYSWMNGHTVIHRIPPGVKVLGLKYRWMSVGRMAGAFECSDPFLQRLWEMGRNTLFVCARDNFMDCPDRERALWIGDVSDQAGYLFYLMDDSGRALLRKAIYSTMAFSDKGVFGALGPLRIRELPSQSLQFIPQGIWQYYLNTGDAETLRYVYPYVHDYLALWKFHDNGLPVARRGGSPDSWDWYDWGEKDTTDNEVIQCALYYMALESARTMALELGDHRDLAWYEGRIAGIRRSFDQAFWQDGFYSSSPDKFRDDRANALAILSGLADRDRATQIVRRVLVSNLYCSPHFEWMVEEAMCRAGFHREALERMKARYRAQVDRPSLTTLHENFPHGGTYNHAWNAPNTVLAKHIAGIAPLQPGWSEYAVLPNPLHLSSLRQVVPSVKGNIVVDLRRAANTTTLTLTSPPGTIALVGIPLDRGRISRVTANNILIWENGAPVRGVSGVSPVAGETAHLRFKAAPGTWIFEARHE